MTTVFNTLTKQHEQLPEGKKLNMFVCGPTVYDHIHVGNARTFVVFDIIAKYLRYRNYELFYLQNITDIDDKIIKRAEEEHSTHEAVARQFTTAFLEDAKTLGITSINKYAAASEHIPEIIKQVEALIAKGFAYTAPAIHHELADTQNHDVYFSVAKFKDYGKLSGRGLEEETESRIENEANKKDSRDFVLWKAQHYATEPAWESPWGMGRPGWHIEDTAITEHYFGPQYDIHGGGQDLIFPHHEAEIAQQESASGKSPFVAHWLHAGFLVTHGQKMSKSLKNFDTAHSLLKQYSPETLRLYFISAHYRSELDYSEENLASASESQERIQELYYNLTNSFYKEGLGHSDIPTIISKAIQDFATAMDEDFNTPKALGSLFETIRTINIALEEGTASLADIKSIASYLEEINSVLGIIDIGPAQIPEEITNLVKKREQARADKDFSQADELRSQIESSGFTIKDTPRGTFIRKLNK